jgi:hypothetical protein
MARNKTSAVTDPDWYRVAYALAAAYANRAARGRKPPPVAKPARSESGATRPPSAELTDAASPESHAQSPSAAETAASNSEALPEVSAPPKGHVEIPAPLKDAWSAAHIAERTLLAGSCLPPSAADMGELFDDVLAPALLVLWAGATRAAQEVEGSLHPPSIDGTAAEEVRARRREVVAHISTQVDAEHTDTIAQIDGRLSPKLTRPLRDDGSSRGVSKVIERLLSARGEDWKDVCQPVTPDGVARFLLGGSTQIGYRLAYNLACYYAAQDPANPAELRSRYGGFGTEDPRIYDTAEQLLDRAISGAPPLQRARVASQALHDPSLTPLLDRVKGLRGSLAKQAKQHPSGAASPVEPPAAPRSPPPDTPAGAAAG